MLVVPSGCWLSLSARRAWIEILNVEILNALACVALRKESVDRNSSQKLVKTNTGKSLSARRAWIEIEEQTEQDSVVEGRSPQGERG